MERYVFEKGYVDSRGATATYDTEGRSDMMAAYYQNMALPRIAFLSTCESLSVRRSAPIIYCIHHVDCSIPQLAAAAIAKISINASVSRHIIPILYGTKY